MRFGCCLNMVAASPNWTGIEQIETLAALGYDYAELPLAEMSRLTNRAFSELAHRVEQSGIRCEACNNFFPKEVRLTGKEADLSQNLHTADFSLSRASRLGAECVVFGSGLAKNVPEGFPPAQGYAQIVEFLKNLGPLARGYGITIVIEPLCRAECNLINSYEEGCRLCYDVGDPNVKMLVDFYHMARENEAVTALAAHNSDLLRHVHFANPAGRAFPRSLTEANYSAFFHMLRSIGYNGRISCEAYSSDFPAEAKQTLDFLKANLLQ